VDFAVKEISEDVGRIELFQNEESNRLSDWWRSSGIEWLRTGRSGEPKLKKGGGEIS